MVKSIVGPTFRPVLSMAGLLAAAFILAKPALAGECPADQTGVDVTKPGATEPSGVADNVLASINLADEAIKAEGRNLRLRQLVIQPGGIVPWHSHDDRPAIIYIVSGSVTEYRNTCAVPIEHRAGEVAPEMHGTAHWWKNTGTEPAVLLSADILHEDSDEHMM